VSWFDGIAHKTESWWEKSFCNKADKPRVVGRTIKIEQLFQVPLLPTNKVWAKTLTLFVFNFLFSSTFEVN
jgi:hypothetical protein